MCKIICVTNRKDCAGDFLRRIEEIAASGVHRIILREKDLDADSYTRLAAQVLLICEHYHVPLTLHTYVQAAETLGIRHIHLPLGLLAQQSAALAGRFDEIGASCHSPAEAQEAVRMGASYLIAGHIFATDCKRGLPGRGLPFLREVCAAADKPVFAIGGITPGNIADVRNTGAQGVCVMSGLMRCENAADYISALKRGEEHAV